MAGARDFAQATAVLDLGRGVAYGGPLVEVIEAVDGVSALADTLHAVQVVELHHGAAASRSLGVDRFEHTALSLNPIQQSLERLAHALGQRRRGCRGWFWRSDWWRWWDGYGGRAGAWALRHWSWCRGAGCRRLHLDGGRLGQGPWGRCLDCRGWHRSWGLGSPGRWYGLGLYLVDGGWCRRGRGLDCWSWGGWALGLSLGCCLCSALGGLLGPALCLVECLLAGLAPALDGGGGGAKVYGGFAVDALGSQRAVVNTLGAARAG